MNRTLQGVTLGVALMVGSVLVHAQSAPQPGPPGMVPLNLSMEKLQLDTLKCKAFEAEANFHAYSSLQLSKERDALNAKIKELEGKIAGLEAPKDPPVDILKGTPP